MQLPVPVRGGVDDSHPAAQAPGGQLAEQQRVQRVVRYDRNAQRQHVVEDTVIAHVGGRQHQVPGFLMVAQASTVPDHQHQVRAQHGEVIGDRLGVRRPDAYVHHGHARTPGKHVVPRGHLAAIRIRAAATRQSGAKLLHVPGVVGQQHIPLERLGRCPGVVLEPVDGQGHALRREQEQFLAPQIPAGFVNGRRKTWITQIQCFAPRDRPRSERRSQPAGSVRAPGTSGWPEAKQIHPPAPDCGPTRAAPRSAAGNGQPGRLPPWRRIAAGSPPHAGGQAWQRSPLTRSPRHHARAIIYPVSLWSWLGR